ncbi:MAG: ABC transporter permease subunit [Planctomycetota bacterium]
MTITLEISRATFRECWRRPLVFVSAAGISVLALVSRLFLGFSFGAEATEVQGIAVSAIFLSGLVLAGLVGTALIRRDMERGTFGWILSKPVDLQQYVAGRFAGLFAATAAMTALVAIGLVALSLVFPFEGPPIFDQALFAAWLRCVLLLAVLDAAAIAASAVSTAVVAPLLMLGLFLWASVAPAQGQRFFGPDFTLFALDPAAHPPWLPLASYAAVFCSIFLLLAYIFLSFRTPIRGSG